MKYAGVEIDEDLSISPTWTFRDETYSTEVMAKAAKQRYMAAEAIRAFFKDSVNGSYITQYSLYELRKPLKAFLYDLECSEIANG